jgi:hypothetical protein
LLLLLLLLLFGMSDDQAQRGQGKRLYIFCL